MRTSFNHAKYAITVLFIAFLAFPTAVLAATQIYSGQRLPVSSTLEKSAIYQTYDVIDLGTLGGVFASASGITDRGWINGTSSLRGDRTEHAVVWRDGRITDLGTLGGLDSSAAFPFNDDRGIVLGNSLIPTVDPLGENFFGYTCGNGAPCEGYQSLGLGFFWQDGTMRPLPPLGGNYSWALGMNNRGQVVGLAETAIRDPQCLPPQILRYEAVIWNLEGQVRMLSPFPGDTIGVAFANNDRGQIVGGSGFCGPLSPAVSVHALLWEDHSIINLGSFGGKTGNYAAEINNLGQVIGNSDLPGDVTTHGFLWEKGTMRDLGTLPGDASSFSSGINNQGNIVGNSCDSNFNCRAFFWQDGNMVDLNTLVSVGPLYLVSASDINARGEIVGNAVVIRTGESHAFLAIPRGEYTSLNQRNQRRKFILPAHTRAMLQERWRLRPFAG